MAKQNINSKSSTCVFLDWTHKTNRQTRQNRHTSLMAKQNINSKHSTNVFLVWTHRTNNIFIQSILPMSLLNGHTGQTVKQHIHSKYSTHIFLEWIHRTNGQTAYSFKAVDPCLFIMDTLYW